jgi:hypothetical protein
MVPATKLNITTANKVLLGAEFQKCPLITAITIEIIVHLLLFFTIPQKMG